jgi:hypothetical protein
MEDSQKIPDKPKKRGKKAIIKRIRHTKEAKDKAAKYYLMGLTLPEISKLTDNTPIRTLEKWQLSGKWTTLKNPVNIKNQVLQLFESGKTRKEIALLVNRDESTVYRWIQTAKKNDENG